MKMNKQQQNSSFKASCQSIFKTSYYNNLYQKGSVRMIKRVMELTS